MFCAKRFWMSSLLHACIKWSGFGIKNDCESVLYWMGTLLLLPTASILPAWWGGHHEEAFATSFRWWQELSKKQIKLEGIHVEKN